MTRTRVPESDTNPAQFLPEVSSEFTRKASGEFRDKSGDDNIRSANWDTVAIAEENEPATLPLSQRSSPVPVENQFIEVEFTESRLLDLLILLGRHKRIILQSTIAATILGAILAALLPNRYTATASILPPQQSQSLAASMIGQLGALGPMAGLAQKDLGLKNPGDLYIVKLRSRKKRGADPVERMASMTCCGLSTIAAVSVASS